MYLTTTLNSGYEAMSIFIQSRVGSNFTNLRPVYPAWVAESTDLDAINYDIGTIKNDKHPGLCDYVL